MISKIVWKYYYLDDAINMNDLYLDNILIDQKSYETILIYDVAYKNPYGVKPVRIIFYKVDGYIIKYAKTRFYCKTKPSIIWFKWKT